MRSHLRENRYIQAIASCLLGLFCVFLLSPNFNSIKEFEVKQSEIKITPAGLHQVSRRLNSSDDFVLGHDQFKKWKDFPKQYHYDLAHSTDKKLGIFIPNLGGACRLFINGSMDEACIEQSNGLLFYGSHYLYTELNEDYLSDYEDRIDVLQNSDPLHVGLREIYIGDLGLLDKPFNSYLKKLKFNYYLKWLLSIGIVFLGIISFFINRTKKVSFIVIVFGVIYLSGAFFTLSVSRFLLPASLIVVSLLLWQFQKTDNSDAYSLGLLGFSILAVLAQFTLLGSSSSPSNPQYLYTLASWGMLPFVLSVGIREFLAGKISYQEYIKQLQEQIDHQSIDLKRKEKKLNETIQKKAILEERQRFTRDIHDGIGSNLLSLLVRLRSNKIELDTVQEEVEASLHDLRLVVDSLDHTGDDLSSMLITFRSRIEPQFVAADISLDWEEDNALLWKPVKTRDILNLYRLIQEAISNILRHSEAKHVGVRISQDQESNLEIVIEDDGVGLPENIDGLHGKGLQNMQFRAKRLNGNLSFEKIETGKGTRVRLYLPQYIDPDIHLK